MPIPTCDSACAATNFKRLSWHLRCKYFSSFESNRARAIQIRLEIIVFQQFTMIKVQKNIDEEDSWKSFFSWGNCICLLFAKLCYRIYSKSFFSLKVFLWNIFPSFQNFKVFYGGFQNMVEKSNFRRKTIFIIVLPEIRYSFLKKILNNASRKNVTRYLRTVLRLTVIQKQETPKTIQYNFVANMKNLKGIVNRSNSIDIALY